MNTGTQPGWELPAEWTDGARELFLGVVEQRPDVAGAELGSLEQAAALPSAAERLDEVALAAGMIATGSTGRSTGSIVSRGAFRCSEGL